MEPYVLWAGPQDRLSQRDKDDPRIDPSGTNGWATINLRGAWSPYSRVRIVAALENLADESYRLHGSGIDAPGINFLLSGIVRL